MTDADSTSDCDSASSSVESAAPSQHATVSSSRLMEGNVSRTVLFLALPVLAEQFLNFMVGFVDTYLSGRISAAATSAIGTGAYVNWLAELLYSMIGIGTTALVARQWGSGDHEDASRVASTSIGLAVLFGSAGVILMLVAAPAFGWFLGLDQVTNDLSVRYLRLSSFGHVFSCVTLVGASALRGAGNMRAPMWILGLVSILNVLFSSMLVFGFGPIAPLGVDGIAFGTIAARGAGCLLMGWVLLSGLTELTPSFGLASLKDRTTARRILRIGSPAAMDGLSMWTGHFLFLKLIAGLDAGAPKAVNYAAHIVGVEVEALNYLPAWAWGTAAATLIGQSLGARVPERARSGGHAAVLQASLLAFVIMLMFYFGADAIYGLMHKDSEVRAVGVPALRLLALFEIPLSVTIVYAVGVRGSGSTIAPMIINFAGVFLVRLPMAWLFAFEFDMGLRGAWLGMGIDIILRSIAMGLYFEFGRWGQTKV
ncbi:MAG: MATE family efflux transporter [Planctomycetota bacterium]